MVNQVGNMNEHAAIVMSLLGVVFFLLIAVLGFIFKYIIDQLKNELKADRESRKDANIGMKENIIELNHLIDKLTGELFNRMKIVEMSLGNLWTEHRMIRDGNQGCPAHVPRRHARSNEMHPHERIGDADPTSGASGD